MRSAVSGCGFVQVKSADRSAQGFAWTGSCDSCDSIPIIVTKYLADVFLCVSKKVLAASKAHKQMEIILLFIMKTTK